MDLSNTPIPTGLSLDSPDIKKARIESMMNELDYETKKQHDLLLLIETKEHEDKETQERFTTVTGINDLGLKLWLDKYFPSIKHTMLPYPYILDVETNLWSETKTLEQKVHDAIVEPLNDVLFENFGLEYVPNTVYRTVKQLARTYENLMNSDDSESNPLVEVQEPNLVPFKNGMYNFDDDSIRPIERTDYVTSTMPYDLIPCDENDPDIQYNKDFVKWLVEDSAPLVYAYMGFLFYRSQETIQTMMIFVNGHTSNGGNGKSKLAELMQDLLGSKKNYSNIKMDELADGQNHKFAKKDLQHKFANFDSESGGTFLKQTTDLKKLSSSDKVSAQVKNKDNVTFSSYARLVMATNQLPDFRDDSEGIRRRWVLVPFTKNLLSDEQKALYDLPTGKFHVSNKKQYMYPNHVMGKFAWFCIQQYKKLIAEHNGANPFVHLMTDEAKQILEGMAYDNDPVAQFINDSNLVITGNEDDFLSQTDLWEEYKLYNDGTGKHKSSFFNSLSKKGAITRVPVGKTGKLRAPRKMVGGMRVNVVAGIKREDLEPLSDEDNYPRLLENGKTRAIDDNDIVEALNEVFDQK